MAFSLNGVTEMSQASGIRHQVWRWWRSVAHGRSWPRLVACRVRPRPLRLCPAARPRAWTLPARRCEDCAHTCHCTASRQSRRQARYRGRVRLLYSCLTQASTSCAPIAPWRPPPSAAAAQARADASECSQERRRSYPPLRLVETLHCLLPPPAPTRCATIEP